MKKNIPLCLSLICGSLLSTAPLLAQENDNADLGSFVEGPKWQEDEITIPAFPNDDDLLKVDVDSVDMPFTFYIDPASLSFGKDYVMRYTVVIKSGTGATNVIYEGIRCSTNEYRTYAYGTYDNKFSKALNSSWMTIKSNETMAHRYNFRRYYLCSDIDRPLSVRESLQRIRYPENFFNDGQNYDR